MPRVRLRRREHPDSQQVGLEVCLPTVDVARRSVAGFIISLAPINYFTSFCSKEDRCLLSGFVLCAPLPWGNHGRPKSRCTTDSQGTNRTLTLVQPLSATGMRIPVCNLQPGSRRPAIAKNDCDLILGPVRLDGESLFSLIGQLRGSRTTLFYYLIVEDGCWWLPAVWLGANCFGAPAIHNSDFATVLDETIEHIRLRARVACRVAEDPQAFHFPAKYRSLYLSGASENSTHRATKSFAVAREAASRPIRG